MWYPGGTPGAERAGQGVKEQVMANVPDPKPQAEQKHPADWQRDLNPNYMAGQNTGGIAEARERSLRTAYDVKGVHRRLRHVSDDVLKQVPILDPGTRLRQAATYLDLHDGRVFTATGDMEVVAGQQLVPKDGVHYDVWNLLVGD
jgi:hypothetical protein